jgi:hypothetical protein
MARILLAAAASWQREADDRAYLEKLVTAPTGLTPEDAKARVDAVLKRALNRPSKPPRRRARPEATFALVGALSLLIGVFIASAAAALGGLLRDDNEGVLDLSS